MEAVLRNFPKTCFVGRRLTMSFASNKTKELWQKFMPRRAEVRNRVGEDLYSVEIYNDPSFFIHFNPERQFEKWATVPVKNFDAVPDEMETLIIPEGLYAIFLYQGKASEAKPFYEYIFHTWIPNSEFSLDNRPHFAVMGKKYKNEDPSSEEELWIPVKKK
jgi:AraC family transcriptional regulator